MSGISDTISCSACGRRFVLKPQLLGKRVKCACGNVFVAEKQQRDQDEYDLIDDSPGSVERTQFLPPVAAQPEIAPAQVPHRQQQLSQDHILQYAGSIPRRIEEQELAKTSRLKTVYLPAILIILGVAFRVAPYFIKGITQQGVAVMAAAAVGALVVNIALMLCGVLIASQILDADFGSLRAAVLKLTATAVVGGGITGWILSLDWAHGGIHGPLVALHAMILIYWIMFAMFFELDLLENLFTVAIVMALHIAAFCAVFGTKV